MGKQFVKLISKCSKIKSAMVLCIRTRMKPHSLPQPSLICFLLTHSTLVLPSNGIWNFCWSKPSPNQSVNCLKIFNLHNTSHSQSAMLFDKIFPIVRRGDLQVSSISNSYTKSTYTYVTQIRYIKFIIHFYFYGFDFGLPLKLSQYILNNAHHFYCKPIDTYGGGESKDTQCDWGETCA